MMFRRKKPLNLWQRARQALWPRSGWVRAAKYVWHRLARLKDSPHGIAAGVASGIAISLTPFVGFHLIGAAGLALATRGNLLAAWVGTLVGNPWTFPFIWIVSYRLGIWFLGETPDASVERLGFQDIISSPISAIQPLLLPMTMGGLPLALISWFLSYWLLRRAIERLRLLRQSKLRMRQSTSVKGAGKKLGNGGVEPV